MTIAIPKQFAIPRSRAGQTRFALAAALLLVLPFVLALTGQQALVRIVCFAMLYVMLALGLNIVVGFAGLLDLGYIAFYAVGAYTWALLASPHFDIHLSFWLVLPLCGVMAGLFGVLLGTPTLKLRGDYLAIVTLGFGEIIRIFLTNLNQPFNLTNGSQGINLVDPVTIGDFSFARTETLFGVEVSGPQKYYYLLLAFTVGIVLINRNLQNSRVGRAWEAIREDEIAAGAMGINTRNLKLLAFALGASFGGIAGALFAAMQGFVSPESFGLFESVLVVAMVVLGGMGNIAGVVLGAVLLAVIPDLLRYVVAPLQEALFGEVVVDIEVLRMLIYGAALVLMMLFRPAGVLPSTVRQRELAQKGEE